MAEGSAPTATAARGSQPSSRGLPVNRSAAAAGVAAAARDPGYRLSSPACA